MDSRLSKTEWALRVAEVTAYRSEDPYQKVGAVALTKDGRVIATAYNGLMPGYEAPEGFWEDRDERLPFMIHAEQNLCSLIRRGEAYMVASTLSPCPSCLLLMAAHGIKYIAYREQYKRPGVEVVDVIAEKYGIILNHVPVQPPNMEPGEIMHVPGYGFLQYGGQVGTGIDFTEGLPDNPTYRSTHPSHKLINPESCDCKFRRVHPCPVCDHGLDVCATCGQAENQLSEPCHGTTTKENKGS